MVGSVCPSSASPLAIHRLIIAPVTTLILRSWGGSRIIRYTKEGKMDLEVFFPTALNVTACTFGGKQGSAAESQHGCDRTEADTQCSRCSSLCAPTGPKNDQLYVTTAHCGACGGDASRQSSFPDSGNVFVVDLSGQFAGGEWRFEFAG